jgi:cytochrome c oxidase assembly protein subunit 15
MVAILRNKRRDLRTLGLVQILGILAQGVLGGITVLTGLNPATVSAHFLLSIVLIAAALSLRQRAHGVTPTDIKLAPLTRRLARITVALTALVIFAGTIVTGSGPHAGDDLAERFNLDPRMMSWIHADLVIALIGVTVALLIAIRLGEAEDTRSSWGVSARNFLIICLAQGVIGYTQYFTGLPELLVGFHILGSVLVWLTVWNLTIKGNVLSRS